MVICKYFQNGNCRFGSKCVNEHIDIKQIIKSEVEAAVKGSQWPLSCFGPFKEKICIPNFIDDQSFEEIRHLCYEAKKQNCFPQFQQQFNQQVLEAQNKMNQLLSLNPEIVNIITQIYESGTETTKGISSVPSNPFSSMGTNSTNNSGIFGSNPIQTNPFAKPTSTGFASNTPVASSSIFGSGVAVASPSSGNIFGSNTQTQPSIFGGGSVQQPQQQSQQQQQSNPFGGGFTAQQQTGSIFATQTPQQQTSSIFGANANQSSNNFQSNPAFGNTFSSTNNSSTAGIFASNQPTPSSNIFQQANTGNIFAQGSTNVSQQSFGQQQPIQQPFGQQQAIQQPNTAFSNQPTQNKAFAFSSFLQNPNQPTPSQTQPQGFGQPQTGNQGIFLNSPQPQSQSIFAQAIQDQQQQQQQQQQPQQLAPQQNQTQQNIFGQPVQAQPQAQPFAQPLQNTQQSQPSIFSNQQQSQQQPQQPPMQAVALNTSTPNTNSLTDNSSQNIFAQATNALIQESLQSNNQQQFGAVAGSIGQQMMKNDNSRPGVYSKLESLSNAALEAYKADRFIMGKIPTEPPPKELCF